MKPKEILHILQSLKDIEPRKDFSEESRFLILSTKQKHSLKEYLPSRVSLSGVLSQSFLSHPLRAIAFTFAGVLIIVTAYTATQEISPLFLPGLNQGKVVAEAEMINKTINIELDRLEYFDATNKTGSSALNQVTSKQLDHLNQSILEKEAQNIGTGTLSPEVEMNEKLNEILKQINQ